MTTPPGFADDGWQSLMEATRLARQSGVMTPRHLLAGVLAGGQFADVDRAGSLAQAAATEPGAMTHRIDRGVVVDVLASQAQATARVFADERGELIRPAHLMIALLDQAGDEVSELLDRTDSDPQQLRRKALHILGASPDTPRLISAAFPPAGTVGRPPLPLDQLPADAWRQLQQRQHRLPLRRLHNRTDWFAISRNEQRAVLRLADVHRLDDNQRYSLLHLHLHEVQQRAFAVAPATVRPPRGEPGSGPRGGIAGVSAAGAHGRGRRHLGGWGAWMNNRRVDLKAAWLRYTRQQ